MGSRLQTLTGSPSWPEDRNQKPLRWPWKRQRCLALCRTTCKCKPVGPARLADTHRRVGRPPREHPAPWAARTAAPVSGASRNAYCFIPHPSLLPPCHHPHKQELAQKRHKNKKGPDRHLNVAFKREYTFISKDKNSPIQLQR